MLMLLLPGFIAAALTFAMPRRWPLPWLLLFWVGSLFLWSAADTSVDPASFGVLAFFGGLWPLAGIATLARIAKELIDGSGANQGY
jgi:hypothetical protein